MYLAYDTETNSLQNGRCPAIISIGWYVLNSNFDPIEKKYYLLARPDIKQDQWNPHAQKVHGISREKSLKEGQDPEYVLNMFHKRLSQSKYVIAHNLVFDKWQILQDYKKFRLKYPGMIGEICTMKQCKRLFPKASKSLKSAFELCYPGKYFDQVFNHHNAQSDARACALIFRKMATDYGILQGEQSVIF